MGSACGSTPGSSGVASDRASTPVGRPVDGVQAGDHGAVVRAGADQHRRPVRDLEPLDLAERRVHGFDGTVRRDPHERVAAVGAGHGQDPAVVGERVRRAAEDPGGVAELRLHRRQVPAPGRRGRRRRRARTGSTSPTARPRRSAARRRRARPAGRSRRRGRRRPSARGRGHRPSATSAARRRTASQGMSGWSHSSQASVRPSGDGRGAARSRTRPRAAARRRPIRRARSSPARSPRGPAGPAPWHRASRARRTGARAAGRTGGPRSGRRRAASGRRARLPRRR